VKCAVAASETEKEAPLTSGGVAAASLPCDRPSSALVAQVVGVATGDQDLTGLLREGQQGSRGLSVLQENQGFPDGFTCQFPVFLSRRE